MKDPFHRFKFKIQDKMHNLENLLEKYSIKKISLGQIAYITNEYSELIMTIVVVNFIFF